MFANKIYNNSDSYRSMCTPESRKPKTLIRCYLSFNVHMRYLFFKVELRRKFQASLARLTLTNTNESDFQKISSLVYFISYKLFVGISFTTLSIVKNIALSSLL